MSEYINNLKADGYTSLRETYYQELRTSFPPLGNMQTPQQLDLSQVDVYDQQVDTEDIDGDAEEDEPTAGLSSSSQPSERHTDSAPSHSSSHHPGGRSTDRDCSYTHTTGRTTDSTSAQIPFPRPTGRRRRQ